MLYLVDRADKRDKDVAKFVDSYTNTIAALCRRLEALERGASDRPIADTPVEDAPMVVDGSFAAALIQAESALASDDIPPGPLSEDDLRRGWNQQADEHNQWELLDSAEQLAWAQARAIAADRARAALKAEPEDLAADQAMAANLSALLIRESGLHSPGSSTHDLLQRAAAMLVNYGMPARSATPPAPVPGPTYLDAIRLAQGCHDYSGGHTGAEGEAWHGAIDTVVDVLKGAAVGPWDSQTRAVLGVWVEAEAGEVERLVPVSEQLRIVKAGIRAGYTLGHHHSVEGGWGDPDEVADDIAQETLDDLPAPQAGEVEA